MFITGRSLFTAKEEHRDQPSILCVWVGGCDCSHSDVSKWLESASEPNRPVFWSYFVFLTSQMENSRAVLPNTVVISPT